MPLELECEVGDPRLQRRGLIAQGQHDGADGGWGGVPVRQRNAEGWCKLDHACSMQPTGAVVKPADAPRLVRLQRGLNGYDTDNAQTLCQKT